MWFLEVYFKSGSQEMYVYDSFAELSDSRMDKDEYFGDVIEFFLTYSVFAGIHTPVFYSRPA